MAVHQNAVPSCCQKKHRMFYAHVYTRSRRTNQLTLKKKNSWIPKFILHLTGFMIDLYKSLFCLCFMNEGQRVKVIVHSSAKCRIDFASITSKDLNILMLYRLHHGSRSYDCVFSILDCQPGIGGRSYCK